MWFLAALLAIAWIAFPLWALIVASNARREVASLLDRVRRLESGAGSAAIEAQPVAGAPATAAVASHDPAAEPAGPAHSAHDSTGRPAPRPFFDSARAEDLIGGLWLQNVGAVILLLGAFFSIVWGYTSGRLGAGVLVGAGVLFGFALSWRGDRLARTLPPLGHALIGVGLGIAYLSIYLGWFTLHALAPLAALALLMLIALGTVAAGLWYRAQAVAALGVIGAFVPQLLVALLRLPGFSLTPPELLGYLALVDLVVFALAARAGWSMLDLLALVLTSIAWIATFPDGNWGWPLQCGLAALYAVGGLAPVVRFARSDTPAEPPTLLVIAASPLLFAAVSWPFVERVGHIPSAMLLLALAMVYVAAAWWIDRNRERDDLWRPLTAAGTLFVALALERLASPSYLSMMWLAEGTVLVWLGGGRRGAWLRGCGAVVSFAGACAHCALLFPHDAAQFASLPFAHADSVRALGGIALLYLTGALLRSEHRFGEDVRRLLSRGWVIAATLMLLVYSSNEADHLAHVFDRSGDHFALPPAMSGPAASHRIEMLRAFLTSAMWTLEAAAFMAMGWTRRSAFLRWLGLGLLGLTVLKFALSDLSQVDVFWRFVSALLVGVSLLLVSYFYQRRMRRERTSVQPIRP
jgi:uncharacterized membrane protein